MFLKFGKNCFILLLLMMVYEGDNNSIGEVSLCMKFGTHLNIKWVLKHENEDKVFWQSITVDIGEDEIFKVNRMKMYVRTHECTDILSVIDIQTYWVTNFKESCKNKSIRIIFENFHGVYSEKLVLLNQTQVCPEKLVYEQKNRLCLILPSTIYRDEYFSTNYNCPIYTEVLLELDGAKYRVYNSINNQEILSRYFIKTNRNKFQIVKADLENSNLLLTIIGSYREYMNILYTVASIRYQNRIEVKINSFQIVKLPSVVDLITYKNQKALEIFKLEKYLIKYTVQKNASANFMDIFCNEDSNKINVTGSVVKNDRGDFLLIEPLKCCGRTLKIISEIIHRTAKTINQHHFDLRCQINGNKYFTDYIVVKINSTSDKLFSIAKISMYRYDHVSIIRINITNENYEKTIIICDLAQFKCSNNLINITIDYIIYGKIPKSKFYQFVTIEGSFDQMNFYLHDKKYEIILTDASKILRISEELVSQHVIDGIQKLEWSFSTYSQIVQSFDLSISWNSYQSVVIGSCSKISGCIVKSIHVVRMEFNKVILRYNELRIDKNGFMTLTFNIDIKQKMYIPPIVVILLKKYQVYRIPILKINSKYAFRKLFYIAFIEKSNSLGSRRTSILKYNDVSCLYGVKCSKFNRKSMSYLVSINNFGLKLWKLGRFLSAHIDEFVHYHHLMIGKSEWTFNETNHHLPNQNICPFD